MNEGLCFSACLFFHFYLLFHRSTCSISQTSHFRLACDRQAAGSERERERETTKKQRDFEWNSPIKGKDHFSRNLSSSSQNTSGR